MHGTTQSCSGSRGGTGLSLAAGATRVPQPEETVLAPLGSGASSLCHGGVGGFVGQHSPHRAGTGGSILPLLCGLRAVSSKSLNLMLSPLSNMETILLTSTAFDWSFF